MIRLVRLFWKRFLLSVAEKMHDRADFTVELIGQVGMVGMNLIFFRAIYANVPQLGGWSYHEALLILGLYQLMDGLSNLMLRVNVRRIAKFTRMGQFDALLVQPVDPQLNLIRRFDLANLGVMISGLLIIGYASQTLGLAPLLTVGITLISTVLGFLLHWSVMFGIATFGFWLIRIEHLAHLALVILDLGRLPTTAYGPYLGGFLTFVIPIALVATLPAQVATGQNVWHLVVIAATVVGVLFALSRAFFFYALRSYSSASG